MKTITMYELLGLVKDGKELPKKVKAIDVIYEYDDHYRDYYNKSLDRFLFVYMTSEEEWKLAYFLNIQVEILEEEKKIPEKIEREIYIENGVEISSEPSIKQIMDKFNQLIDYLKSKGDE